MPKLLIKFAVCAGLAGLPALTEAGLMSATGKVIAIMGGDLFVGEAEGYLDGSGSLSIHSQKDPQLTCSGQFTSSKDRGAGQMNCTDGSTASFRFRRLTVFRGFGEGDTSRGALSFAYGLSAKDAAPYLKLPMGKKLALNGKELELVGQ